MIVHSGLESQDLMRHLSYCSNIFSGENWSTHFAEIKDHWPSIKRKVCPDQSLGLGLRLSHKSSLELINNSQSLEAFKFWLDQEGIYVYTLNVFPFDQFHDGPVKEKVYYPDWTSQERLDYTVDAGTVLSKILPDNCNYGSLSTVPLGYQDLFTNLQAKEKCVRHLKEVAQSFRKIYKETGKKIVLALEPEPFCQLEDGASTIQFLQEFYEEAGGWTREYIGLCWDICHSAVVFEDLGQAFKTLEIFNIPLYKVQISSAWRFYGSLDNEDISYLKDPVYLHQTYLKKSESSEIISFRDVEDIDESSREVGSDDEWRIHYHVPIYLKKLKRGESTQDILLEFFKGFPWSTKCEHFEVETYTYSVLPEEEKKTNLVDQISEEILWVKPLLMKNHL